MTFSEVLLHDVKLAAVHEAGHFVVAQHLNLRPRIELVNESEQYRDDYKANTLVRAQTIIGATPTPFQNSIFAWGGVLAEAAVKNQHESAQSLAEEVLKLCTALELNLSMSDMDGIFGHRQYRRTCKLAAQVVFENLDRIREIEQLAVDHLITGKQPIFTYAEEAA